jgi:hypothetical protein
MYGDSKELRDTIDRAVRDDAIFIKALGAMRTWVASSGSVKGLYLSLQESIVASFIDSKAAKERLNKIRDDQGLSDELRRSADELLAVWFDNIPH